MSNIIGKGMRFIPRVCERSLISTKQLSGDELDFVKIGPRRETNVAQKNEIELCLKKPLSFKEGEGTL